MSTAETTLVFIAELCALRAVERAARAVEDASHEGTILADPLADLDATRRKLLDIPLDEGDTT